MHHREHIVILRPGVRGLLLHSMFYADEVRQEDECRADGRLVRDKELELARLLIRAGVEEFRPEKYHDTYRANVQRLIEGKLAGQQFQAVCAAPLAPVIDILEALKRSLDMCKKPSQAPVAHSGNRDTSSPPLLATGGEPGPGPSRRRHAASSTAAAKTAARGRSR